MRLDAAETPPPETLRTWIQEMKQAPRGPFSRLRWFCRDGAVLPPKAYACAEHGGGVQHGEWQARTKQLRAYGYKIANVLAALDMQTFTSEQDYPSTLKQIVIEQFLIAADDGWIMRRARFYRGALQAEDEAVGARRLLLGLLEDPQWVTNGFVPVRMAARFLPHGQDTRSIVDVRQRAAVLSDKDKQFMPLRNKIHGRPDRGDAARVRQYATKMSDTALRAEFERLAADIDAIYASAALPQTLRALAKRLPKDSQLAKNLQDHATSLAAGPEPAATFALTGTLMATLRDHLPTLPSATVRLHALDTQLALENDLFAAATALRKRLPTATRQAQLGWLQGGANALYGAGLITARQHKALNETFTTQLHGETASLSQYKAGLDYLALAPVWANQWLDFYFAQPMHTLATIEPLADRFIQDQLRGSPLLFYTAVLDHLTRDANRIAGIRHRLFNQEVGVGLRSLNPGLARGVLRVSKTPISKEVKTRFDPNGIYLLPETTSDLPPVAGILTGGEGNPLSHVQLLARNLGIPNVGIDNTLVPQLTAREGMRVILAVSPGGVVYLAEDRGQWDAHFDKAQSASATIIRPDLAKLNLQDRALIPTRQLRASDSGRTVGPKAAQLGELYHHFPDAVVEGLAIPFGVFRALLAQPMDGENKDVFAWMVEQYAMLRTMAPGSQAHLNATQAFRQRLADWLLQADPGADFRRQLRTAMGQVFGRDGAYGVFVRSDTNVEDLPGFTGAGLNLTVPNAVGFEQVVDAVTRVWASPFSQRAYAWRQSHMEQPQHMYPAVLLLRSVPAEKSGVMVTQDIDTGSRDWLSIAINEGVGGAVDGQLAESLRVHMPSGRVRLLAQATAPSRRMLQPQGGVTPVPVSGEDRVLTEAEIAKLIDLAQVLPSRFPDLKDAEGNAAPADVEFGFLSGQLLLFQIRPFVENTGTHRSDLLRALDSGTKKTSTTVNLNVVPKGNTP